MMNQDALPLLLNYKNPYIPPPLAPQHLPLTCPGNAMTPKQENRNTPSTGPDLSKRSGPPPSTSSSRSSTPAPTASPSLFTTPTSIHTRTPRYVLMAVGNPGMADDGLALHAARLLTEMDMQGEWLIIPCNLYPENFCSKAAKHHPELVVILDAVDMGAAAGEIRMIEKKGLDTILLSTHRMPLSFLVSYLAEQVENVVFIGVQPRKIEEGNTLSAEAEKAARTVAEKLYHHTYQQFKT